MYAGAAKPSLRYPRCVLDDLYVLRDRARAAANRGDFDGAAGALLSAAGQTHVAEHDYVAVLRPLEDVLGKRGDQRGAMTILGYLSSSDPTAWKRAASILPHVPPVDRARILAAQGRMAEAARETEDAGLVAAAAIYREKAKDWAAARALWSRLAHVTERGNDAYVAALVRFNLARAARQCGDVPRAREAIVASVRLLEEAADHFESVGLRERAFDCFQVLVQIGRESGAFEDVLEGFVNCIRILREDHLKYFALEYFEESIAAAAERGETSAAATLAREAADYARSLGLAATGASYAMRQAELWQVVAKQQLDRGAPPEIAENALLAAVLAFGEVGQYARVGGLYRELAELDLEPLRRKHYARVAERYASVKNETMDSAAALAQPVRQDAHFTEVWHVDVLEWEEQGSAAEACADVLLDKRWPDLIRRKAMVARLTALEVEARPDDDGSTLPARLRLAEQLSQLQLYAVLSPREKLFERPERQVKLAVLQAMQTLFFKRSFVTVRAGTARPRPRRRRASSKGRRGALLRSRRRSAVADPSRVRRGRGKGLGSARARAHRYRRGCGHSSRCSGARSTRGPDGGVGGAESGTRDEVRGTRTRSSTRGGTAVAGDTTRGFGSTRGRIGRARIAPAVHRRPLSYQHRGKHRAGPSHAKRRRLSRVVYDEVPAMSLRSIAVPLTLVLSGLLTGCATSHATTESTPASSTNAAAAMQPAEHGAAAVVVGNDPGHVAHGLPLTPTGRDRLAAFAAGCFWGVEDAFRHVPGVVATSVGYAGGHTTEPTYEQVCSHTTGHAETVLVEFDPTRIPYEQLLRVFWKIHDPTQVGGQGPDMGDSYRSVIFTFDDNEAAAARASMQAEQRTQHHPITTEIRPMGTFYKAEEYHQQYAERTGHHGCPIRVPVDTL